MNVLLIGTGAIGSFLVSLFAKEPGIRHVQCASLDPEALMRRFGARNGKFKFVKMNAADTGAVIEAGGGADLIINASVPQMNTSIMRAALSLRAHYVDFCSYLEDYRNPEQICFHDAFQKKGILGLINTGISPGLTNLLAGSLADELDSIRDITIRVLENQEGDELQFFFSPSVSIDEVASPPLIYRDGEFHLIEPFANEEQYGFPSAGVRSFSAIYGDEVATLPHYIPVTNVEYKAGGNALEAFKFLHTLGFFNASPVSVFGSDIVPKEFIAHYFEHKMSRGRSAGMNGKKGFFGVSVEARGLLGGSETSIAATALPAYKKARENFVSAPIAHPAAAAGLAFIKAIPSIPERGVYPPEALSATVRNSIFTEIQKQGIMIQKNVLTREKAV